jgi:hypothetical protein
MNKIIAISLGLVLSQASLANADLDKLQSLFNSGQSLQAYEYSNNIQSQYEGDPRFDYYFGAAAIDVGHASQGVFALERVLIDDPNNNAARLELARGYFTLEELARSRQEFESILDSSPPKAVKEKVEQYLDAIRLKESRYQTSAQTSFRIGLGADDNVNVATDKTSYSIPGISLSAPNTNASNLAQDSFVNELEAGINLNIPINARVSVFGGTQLQTNTYTDASDFNNQSLTMNAGIKHRTGQHLFTYQGFHQSYILNSDFYRNRAGLNLQYQYQLSQQRLLQAFTQASQSDHATSSAQDADLLLFGVNYIHQLNYRLSPTISASMYGGKERIQKSNANTQTLNSYFGRDFLGFSTAMQIQTTPKSSLHASIIYQDSEAPELFLAGLNLTQTPTEAKNDKLYSLNIKYTYLLNRHWKAEASANVSKNNSNIGLFDYDKNRLMLNFIYGH